MTSDSLSVSGLAELADALRTKACPTPECFLPSEWALLPAADRARINAHVADCPACQSERALAAVFEEPANERAVTLAATASRVPPRSNDAGWQRPTALAATAVFAVLGLSLWLGAGERGLPAIPDALPEAGVSRGAAITLLRVQYDPLRLQWTQMASVDHYQVSVLNATSDVIWTAETKQTIIEPPKIDAPRGQRWRWQVEAFDADGTLLARSAVGQYAQERGSGP